MALKLLAHLQRNEDHEVEPLIRTLFDLNMDNLREFRFIYAYYKEKLVNAYKLIKRNLNINEPCLHLMKLYNRNEYESVKNYLIQLAASGNERASCFTIYFWLMYYLYEENQFADIVEISKRVKFAKIELNRTQIEFATELSFYVAVAHFKRDEYAKAMTLFNAYPRLEFRESRVEFYKALIEKKDAIRKSDTNALKNVLIKFMTMLKNGDSRLKQDVSEYELRWHIGQSYFYLANYDEAKQYIGVFREEIKGVKNKVGFSTQEFVYCYSKTLYNLREYGLVIQVLKSAERELNLKFTDDEMCFVRGVCYYVSSVETEQDTGQFLASQREAFQCFDRISHEYTDYKQSVLPHKLVCLNHVVLLSLKAGNQAQLATFLEKYHKIELDLASLNKDHSDALHRKAKNAVLTLTFHYSDTLTSHELYLKMKAFKESQEFRRDSAAMHYYMGVSLFKWAILPNYYKLFYKTKSSDSLYAKLTECEQCFNAFITSGEEEMKGLGNYISLILIKPIIGIRIS